MNAYLKDILREIKNTPGRFLSLLIITALGAASVVGIQATSIDMRAVADTMYKAHSLYDIQVKSATGFNDDDVAALLATPGVARVMPTTVYDVFVSVEGENRAVRTYALPDGINAIEVIEGRLPEGPGECAVESRLLRDGGVELGGQIRLGLDDMGDYYDVFSDEVFTVVGVVSSPLYISFDRGNTTLGDGSLSYYLYLHPGSYTLDVYTDAYIVMEESGRMDNLTDGYYTAADGWQAVIEQTGARRVQALNDELADAGREIEEGWAELYDGYRELDEKTADAERELNDARLKLIEAKDELLRGQAELDDEIAEALEEIEKREKEAADGQRELDEQILELNRNQARIDQSREELYQSLERLSQMGPQGVSPELDAYYEQAYAGLDELERHRAAIDEGRAAAGLAQGALADAKRRISEARATLEDERVKAQAEIDDGWAEYTQGLADYDEGVAALEKDRADALIDLADAERELYDAQAKLRDAPTPEWYYFTRKAGLAYDSYYQDTLRLERIGYVFPSVFFFVAVMVSLTSMSRMVDDHRTQIGIYKALGYRPAAIMLKYLIYAFGASILGGVGGVMLGSHMFPLIISDAYGHLYNMPAIDTPIPGAIAVLAVAMAVSLVVFAALWTCARSMRGEPALLMRPRPPANGKRVLLERLPAIWGRMGFFGKVSARNIFRYKRRFIMTLAGVAGCSALLVTAFGLRDSVGAVAVLQYENIIKYDSRAYLKDIATREQREKLAAILPDEYVLIREEAVTANGAAGGLPASVIVPDAGEGFEAFIALCAPATGEPVPLTAGSVVITEKLARVMGVSVGDSFAVTYGDGRVYEAVATGVADNYIQHYIYMSKEAYGAMTGHEPLPNSALIFAGGGRDYVAPLLENSDVRAVIHNDDLLEQISDSTDAMSIVTVVLIVLACALALVVLFNLTNINISERIRELATIKVLGFNNTELAMYIYRENGVVTLLGIVLGLVAGMLLHGYVITTVEIDVLKFPRIIYPPSYMLAVALSLVFAVFVNIAMNYRLSRIDMVESLKNVE